MIHRSKRQHGYTVIDNQVFRDNSLSWQAMGLLCYVLSKPDNWRIHAKQLMNVTKGTAKHTKRDGVYAILTELKDAGFVSMRHTGNDGYEWSVHDTPEEKQMPDTDKPDTDKPDTDKPDTDKPDGIINTERQTSTDLKQPLTGSKVAAPENHAQIEQHEAMAKPQSAPSKLGAPGSVLVDGEQVEAEWIPASDGWTLQEISSDGYPGMAELEADEHRHQPGWQEPRKHENQHNQQNASELRINDLNSQELPLYGSMADSAVTAKIDGKTRPLRKDGKPVSDVTWLFMAYNAAYQDKYGIQAPSSAKANRQLQQVIARIGLESALAVAAIYPYHTGAYYNRTGHGIASMLQDCEKLRMEALTGRRVTGISAQQDEATGHNLDVMRRVLERIDLQAEKAA
ncbi:hypothetical protein VSS37_03300 [Candidatus Thiothrix sp. Deng01]|uniref:Bacteriophage lambda Replication protein O N-terminal domain-containing protein n=1 Tax=Candidatus Thiothrix phosphatis TaxID=3112415 RepID=A0ABU6CT41_9GAMM|nr:hypothetical protein [Candidatus Thiothrix sp. Deng01]MEB4589996.1 hypothetical protein [Candidatus Thiothrix sp. Deng01]